VSTLRISLLAFFVARRFTALANAIIALLKDEAKREKRQINFVGDKSWKVITEKYIEFYKTII